MPTPKRILIVEDEENLAKMMQTILEDKGYEAHVATGGAAALREIREHYFDLILLDLNMPEVDGILIAKSTHEWRPSTKIFVVTGRKAEYEEELKTIKVDYLLQKPVRMNELLEKITMLLGPSPARPVSKVTTGVPKAKLLFVEHDDMVFTNLFLPFFKHMNAEGRSSYEISYADDKEKAVSLARMFRPDIVLLNTNAIEFFQDLKKEIDSTVATLKEIIIHGKELYAKNPEELGLDRTQVTAIEGGLYNLDYPERLEKAVREIAYRHGLVEK